MALQLNVILESGLQVEDVYARIQRIGGDKHRISAAVAFYVSQQHYIDDLSPLSERAYAFNPTLESEDNFIKQAYLYLKTLDDFKDSIDC